MTQRNARRVRVERGLYRKGNTYQACATDSDGKVVWTSLGDVGLMEARRLRDTFATETRGKKSVTSKATFGEVAALFMEEQASLRDSDQIRACSYTYHAEALRLHILPAVESRQVRSLTADDLTKWIGAQQAKGYKAWTVRRHWMTLRAVLGFAARRGYAATNVADLLTRRERPSNGAASVRYLEAGEIDKLLVKVDGREKLALMLCVFCGLRLGEMLALRWCDVSFDEGLIRVTGQIERATRKRVDYAKTKAGIREPVLMKGLSVALKAHKLAAPFSGPLDYVIASDTGTVMDRSNLRRKALQAPCKAAGLSGVGFHVLRHTFASILISQGQDAIYVASQMGHENPSITLDVYGHLFARAKNAETHRDRLDSDFGHLFGSAN